MVRKSTRRSWPLTESTYGICIKWDPGGKDVDLDLQAVIVDDKGHVVDAVYYNNMFAMNGAVGLSGDNAEDESIWVRFEKLPDPVRLIIFVVAAYSGGSLRDVNNGRVVVMERQKVTMHQFKQFALERSRADADMVVMFKRFRDDTWGLVELDEPAEHGSHFLDILEPTIGDLIRMEIPNAPLKQHLSFVMDKRAVVDFPQGDSLRRLVVAVGGTFLTEDVPDTLSIELEAVFFSASGEMLGAVRGDHRGMFGVERLVDEMEDEEAMTMDLVQVPQKVAQIFLVVLIDGDTFKSVESTTARVIDQSLSEIMRYEVKAEGHPDDSGLVIARVLRKEKGNRWGIETVGEFFKSEKYKEELHAIAATMPVEGVAGRRKKAAPKEPESPKGRSASNKRPAKVSTEAAKKAAEEKAAARAADGSKASSSKDAVVAETTAAPVAAKAAATAPAANSADTAPIAGTLPPNEPLAAASASAGGATASGEAAAPQATYSSGPKKRALFSKKSTSSFHTWPGQPQESTPAAQQAATSWTAPAPREVVPPELGALRTGSTSKSRSIVVSLGEVPEAVRQHLARLQVPRTLEDCPERFASEGWATPDAKAKALAPESLQPSDTRSYDEHSHEQMAVQQVCRGTCTFTPSFCVAEVSHTIAE